MFILCISIGRHAIVSNIKLIPFKIFSLNLNSETKLDLQIVWQNPQVISTMTESSNRRKAPLPPINIQTWPDLLIFLLIEIIWVINPSKLFPVVYLRGLLNLLCGWEWEQYCKQESYLLKVSNNHFFNLNLRSSVQISPLGKGILMRSLLPLRGFSQNMFSWRDLFTRFIRKLYSDW